MKNIISKELRLAATKLSYFFVAAAFLTFTPGYPILLGGFFTTLGIFYSFQIMRENHDIDYSMLLPISKSDIVKGKFAFALILEACSFFIMAVITVIRMTVLKDAEVYLSNALMGANLAFLGYALLMFGLFNFCFIRGFFKTGYYIGKPFICYCIAASVLIVVAEILYHVPGLEFLNAFGFNNLAGQIAAMFVGIIGGFALTFTALKSSIALFEKTDL